MRASWGRASVVGLLVVALAGAGCSSDGGEDAAPTTTAAAPTTAAPPVEPTATPDLADQPYRLAVPEGVDTDRLAADVYLPDGQAQAATLRPVVVLFHSGGFTGGDRGEVADAARSWADAGYVAVAAGYRIDPGAADDATRLAAVATGAVDDGMEVVRWVRSQATAWSVDPGRIGLVGASVGGAIALGIANGQDPDPAGNRPDHGIEVAAVATTGIHLTVALEAGQLQLGPDLPPVLMFHHETDGSTGSTADEARTTCDAIVAAGSSCELVVQPGTGHTIALGASGPGAVSELAAFLADHLAPA